MDDRAQERTKRCQIASGGQEAQRQSVDRAVLGGPGCGRHRRRALGEMSRSCRAVADEMWTCGEGCPPT